MSEMRAEVERARIRVTGAGITLRELRSQYGAALRSGNAALFVGAGLSLSAGAPSWSKLVRDLAGIAGIPAVQAGALDFPALVDYAEVANPTRVRNKIYKEIGAGLRTEPSRAHHLLARLPLSEIWTTNYDALIEAALRAHHRDFQVVTEDADIDHILASGSHSETRVFKPHGSAESHTRIARGVVLSRRHYARNLFDRPRMLEHLRQTIRTRPTLFLGTSFTDPTLFYHVLGTIPKASDVQHYRVTRLPPIPEDDGAIEEYGHQLRLEELQARSLEKFYKVRTIFIDDFHEVDLLLEDLAVSATCLNFYVGGSVSAPGHRAPTADPDRHRALCRWLGQKVFETGDAKILSGEFHVNVGRHSVLGALAQMVERYNQRAIAMARDRTVYVLVPHRTYGELSSLPAAEVAEIATAIRRDLCAKLGCMFVVEGGGGTMDEAIGTLEARRWVVPLGFTGGTARRLCDLFGEVLRGDDRADETDAAVLRIRARFADAVDRYCSPRQRDQLAEALVVLGGHDGAPSDALWRAIAQFAEPFLSFHGADLAVGDGSA